MTDPRFFNNAGPFALDGLVTRLAARLAAPAPPGLMATDLAMLQDAGPTDLAMFADGRYRDAFLKTRAGFILTTADLARDTAPAGARLLLVDSPRVAFAEAAWLFYPDTQEALGLEDERDRASLGPECRISSTAVIGAGARIGARTQIGAHAVIGAGVVLGEDCVIAPNVTISHSIIGNRVRIFPNATVGVHGFGFVPTSRGLRGVPQLGRVLLDDEVEIGANSCVDRGALGDTIIGYGAKIDNQVQVGHNCRIGRHAVLAGHSGLAGSVEIGDGAQLGGASRVGDHLKIGSGGRVAGGSGVTRDVPPGVTVAGYPAIPVRDWHRQAVGLARMFSLDRATPE